MILPAMGMVSDIIATFARRPLFGYRAMIYSIAGIAGLGFIVWGHPAGVSRAAWIRACVLASLSPPL